VRERCARVSTEFALDPLDFFTLGAFERGVSEQKPVLERHVERRAEHGFFVAEAVRHPLPRLPLQLALGPVVHAEPAAPPRDLPPHAEGVERDCAGPAGAADAKGRHCDQEHQRHECQQIEQATRHVVVFIARRSIRTPDTAAPGAGLSRSPLAAYGPLVSCSHRRT
jgi:hypothetical protein